MGVVVRRYIDFIILLIPTPLVSVLLQQHPYFCSLFLMFFVLVPILFVIYVLKLSFFAQYKHIRATTGVPRKRYEGCT